MIHKTFVALLATLLLSSILLAQPEPPKSEEYIVYKDSKVHDIKTDLEKPVRVDYIAPGETTTVNLMPGGGIWRQFETYQECTVNISGGFCVNFYSYDNSTINISGGTLHNYSSFKDNTIVKISEGELEGSTHIDDKAKATITGGRFESLIVSDKAQATVSGGRYKYICAAGKSEIKIIGTDFTIDGVPTKDTKILHEKKYEDYNVEDRRLTCILPNKDKLNINVRVLDTAVIILETAKTDK